MAGKKSMVQIPCGEQRVEDRSGASQSPASCEQSINHFFPGKSEMRLDSNAVRVPIVMDIYF